jgi:localization factor PodJL
MAAIPPRLDAIEESIASNRDFVVEAARNAAAEAIRNTANFGSAHDGTIARELADDLKTLEKLARTSEARNTKTFEAIHDTLLKIVDRLASLESGPTQPMQSAAETRFDKPVIPEEPAIRAALANPAFEAGAGDDSLLFPKDEALTPEVTLAGDAEMPEGEVRERKSLFGSFKRGLKGRGKQEAESPDPVMDMADEEEQIDTKVELDADILNRPLEPGSGMPDLNSILKRVRDDRRDMPASADASAGKSDFIAAARRAALAATSEVENQKRSALVSGKTGTNASKGSLLSRQRKPILLAIGAIMIAIAGLQLKNAFLDHPAGLDNTAPIAKAASPEPAPSASVIASNAPDTAEPAQPAPSAETAAPAVQPTAPAGDTLAAPSAASQPAPDSVAAVIATQQGTPPSIGAMQESGTAPAAPAEAPTAVPTIPMEAGPQPLRDAAAQGDAKALFEIGDIYTNGNGVTSDLATAAGWYNLSAERGFAPAQYRLGNLYEKGLGIGRDLGKAKNYYQLAAAQGNASAMHNLAVLFAGGADGAAPDNEAAAHWFTQAAELGVKDSQFNLAILAAKGLGMPQNLEESYKWFALAANAGDKDAAEKRDEVAKAMSPDQLERAKAATALWKPKQMNTEANVPEMPDEWRVSPATTGSVNVEKAIRSVQLILNKYGYDAGGSDGKIGAKTRDAIMAFQKANGLKPTGNIDKDLVRSLLKKQG